MARVMMIVALPGCETVNGTGQDIQSAGQAIAAEGHQAQAGMWVENSVCACYETDVTYRLDR